MIPALLILAVAVVAQAALVGHKDNQLVALREENRVLRQLMPWLTDEEDL